MNKIPRQRPAVLLGHRSEIRTEFARRLQEAMIEKGWNQSDLARHANNHLPAPERGKKRGKVIGRDSISHYVRGTMLPLPPYLSAMAKALGKRPEDLLPTGASLAAAPFEMRGEPDGRVFVNLSCTVTRETAMKIMALLTDDRP